MLEESIREKYTVVIGLEVHAQLQTESKIFCSDANAFGAEPNTHISPISLGHPGTLPKLNKKAVEYAIQMGLACDCVITKHNVFARKNYFYPDLPKGYQITQDKAPICVGGKVWIKRTEASEYHSIPLNRIHMEEDAGKSMHLEGRKETAVDYNRAGVPLIEIVTEPAIHSAEDAGLFLAEIRKMVRYLEVCDGNMEQGSLRCDANISVKLKEASELGKKVEVKNMNSIKNVQKAIEFEVERQIIALEKGEEIVSETRDFDAESGTTSGMRTKEELNDYRYFPDPDLCPLIVEEEWIEQLRANMPQLPKALIEKFTNEYGLPLYDAQILTETKEMAAYFEAVCKHTEDYKLVSNWLMGPVKSYLNEHSLTVKDLILVPEQLAKLVSLVSDNKISSSVASQQIFPLLLKAEEADPEKIAHEQNLIQDSSSDSIQPIIDEVLKDMADKVKAYHKGKKGLIGMFMGEVMKRSKGKVDPKLANKLLVETLDNNK